MKLMFSNRPSLRHARERIGSVNGIGDDLVVDNHWLWLGFVGLHWFSVY